MSRKHRYNPAPLDRLEVREVLSHGGHPISVVASTLQPSQYTLSATQLAIISEVNQAFDAFKSDYGQARATYFASILNQATPGAGTINAFSFYTTQRVELLGQQLLSSFLQAPSQATRQLGMQNPIKKLIATKIIGAQGQAPEGSLARSLYENIPVPGVSAPTESLYSLSQDIAVETARASVINGINIIKVGAFGNSIAKHSKH